MGKKINLSSVLAGQNVGITQKDDKIWLVSFMKYDLGYFDEESCRVEPIENPFESKVFPYFAKRLRRAGLLECGPPFVASHSEAKNGRGDRI